jgi:hypothetical protein
LDNGKGRKGRTSKPQQAKTSVEVGELEVLLITEGEGFSSNGDTNKLVLPEGKSFSTEGDPRGKSGLFDNLSLYGQGDLFWSIGAQAGWKGEYISFVNKELHGIHYNTEDGFNTFNHKNRNHRMRNLFTWDLAVASIGWKRTADYVNEYKVVDGSVRYEFSGQLMFFELESTVDANGKAISEFFGINLGTKIGAIIGVDGELKYGIKYKY